MSTREIYAFPTTLSILRKYAQKALCTKTPLSRGVTGKTFTDTEKKNEKNKTNKWNADSDWVWQPSNDTIMLASDWSFSHFCHAFFSCFHLIMTPLPFCYCKKQIDVSFSCVCPVIDHVFRHSMVKVVCGSTRLSPRGSHSYFDNVMTQFMINNRTDAWKTDINLLSLR